jgi:hypothetical protein
LDDGVRVDVAVTHPSVAKLALLQTEHATQMGVDVRNFAVVGLAGRLPGEFARRGAWEMGVKVVNPREEGSRVAVSAVQPA